MKMEHSGTICLVLLLLLIPGYSAAQNPYYDHGSFPAPGTVGSSAGMRAELDLIEAGFGKLPTISGNANKIVVINSSATAMTATDAPIPSATGFPVSPSTGGLVVITNDSTSGACDAGGGTGVTLCRWSGSAWVGLGGGNGNIITGSSEAKPFVLRGAGGQSAKEWRGYVGSDGNFYWTCYDGSLDNCDKNIKLITGKSFHVLNNSGVPVFTVPETGVLPTATIDCSLAGVNCTITRTKDFEFVGCQAGVAGHIWNTPAANAPAAACDANNTNTIKGYASFDASTDETIYASMFLPPGYVAGSLGVTFVWKSAATSGAAGLCMRAVRVPDGAVSDAALPAQGAGNCVSDTAKGTTLQENHASIAAVTCTSCLANDEVKIAFERDANGGAVTDDMAGDAHVIRAIVSWEELQ